MSESEKPTPKFEPPSKGAGIVTPVGSGKSFVVPPFPEDTKVLRDYVTNPDFSLSADTIIDAFVSSYGPLVSTLNPFGVEQLMTELRRHLEAIQVYRRTVQEINESATSAFTEYARQRNINRHLRDAESLAGAISNKGLLAAAYANAARQFPSADLGQGFATLYAALSSAAEADARSESLRQAALDAKWDEVARHIDYLEARHSTPGHILNYQERIRPILEFMLTELKGAYDRSLALTVGLRRRYGNKSYISEPPSPKGSAYFKRLSAWYAATVDLISRASSSDTVLTRRVALSTRLGAEGFIELLRGATVSVPGDPLERGFLTAVSVSLELDWDFKDKREHRQVATSAVLGGQAISFSLEEREVLGLVGKKPVAIDEWAKLDFWDKMMTPIKGHGDQDWHDKPFRMPDLELPNVTQHENGDQTGTVSGGPIWGLPVGQGWRLTLSEPMRGIGGKAVSILDGVKDGKPQSIVKDVYLTEHYVLPALSWAE